MRKTPYILGCVVVASVLVYLAYVATSAAGQSPPAAYVIRGRATEVRQAAYHERINGLFGALSRAVQKVAPDLIALWLLAAALGLTLIADLGVSVPFDRIPASANELLRIKSP